MTRSRVRRTRLDVLELMLRRHSGWIHRYSSKKKGRLGYRYGELLLSINATLRAISAVREDQPGKRDEQLELHRTEEEATDANTARDSAGGEARQGQAREAAPHGTSTAGRGSPLTGADGGA